VPADLVLGPLWAQQATFGRCLTVLRGLRSRPAKKADPFAESSRKSATFLCGGLYQTKLRQSRHAVVEADLLDDHAVLKL
jgi:hypothetical protein